MDEAMLDSHVSSLFPVQTAQTDREDNAMNSNQKEFSDLVENWWWNLDLKPFGFGPFTP